MGASIGNLQDYWHVIAMSCELNGHQSIKRRLYNRPLLIWRDTCGKVHILDDCCLHQRSPLEVLDFHSNRIVCPYHGWQYDAAGSVLHVPSDHDAADRLRCQIRGYQVHEAYGFVWIGLRKEPLAVNKIPNLTDFERWPATFKQLEFATSDELLIDNFMDPTHTAVVHDGIIRNSEQLTEHQMTITTHAEGVRVEFAQRQENVGFGMRLLFGKAMTVQHTDEFLLPNLVRVTYVINGQPRFLALIACTPLSAIDAGKTLALVQLRYQFGWPTRLVAPLVSLLASRVLRQDHAITAQQYANKQFFATSPENKVAADAVATRVTALRKQIIAGHDPIQTNSQTLTLRF